MVRSKKRRKADGKHSEFMSSLWKNRKYRRAQSESRSRSWTPERKRRHALLIKKKWKDPEYAKAASKGIGTPWTEERKARFSREIRRRWKNPSFAKRVLRGHLGVKRSEETRRNISKSLSDGRMKFSEEVVEKRNRAISSSWTKDKRNEQSKKLTSLSHKEMRRRLKKRNPDLKVVRIVGRGSRSVLKIRCRKCGHKWKAKWYFTLGKCPWCNPHKFGASEEKVRKLIEKVTGWKFPKLRPKFLKGRSSHPMELDGYNVKRGKGFEYQGEDHYIPIFGKKTLKKRKLDDDRKRKLCSRHGVDLLCVSYWKTEEDIIQMIKKKKWIGESK